MKNIFRNPNKSVAAKLIIAIGLLMIVVSFVFWYAILHKQNKDIMFIAVDYGETFIDFAKKSTFSSMSSNDREETRKVIENLSIPEGVHSLRIFDHSGTVRYSSSKERAAESVARGSQACKSCHTDPANSSELSPTPKKWSVY
ncbi:hypothetical protein H8E50_03485, partial [bacterium]|nr:hypothetical protein [bacterium]